MKKINEICKKQAHPVRVLQIGQGNFLRAFADDMIDRANEAGVYDGCVTILQIHGENNPAYAAQDACYTVLLRGKENGETVDAARVITSVAEVVNLPSAPWQLQLIAVSDTLETVISNTTEAGLVYDAQAKPLNGSERNYPALLTTLLYVRYLFFGGDPARGLMMLPCELIENNGGILRDLVLRYAQDWELPPQFAAWVNDCCMFCSTLVDRIVTGYPKNPADAAAIGDMLGYEDALLDIAEPFAFWVIESPDPARAEARFPLNRAGLPVVFTEDLRPYRERKVRILNGAHTAFVPAAYLAGQTIVRDCMTDPVIRGLIDRCIYEEILPTVALPEDEVRAFADSVCERFENPFIDHALLSICLNSVSKWKVRILPTLSDCIRAQKMPQMLVFSFAALCSFYARGSMTEDGFAGARDDGVVYPIRDSEDVIAFFAEYGAQDDILTRFMQHTAFWDMDLTTLPGFADAAVDAWNTIRQHGVRAAMEMML